jgi:two-component system response regulator PilR (NtrC family)
MSKQHVLIIDDEPDIRELLEITLMRMGLETTCAECIADAERAVKEQAFDLCLTDMNLPDGNGIDFVAFVQKHYPNMPIAMITAYGSVETAISALKAGAFDFISKPVDLRQLRGLVESALALAKNEIKEQPLDELEKPLLIGESAAIKTLNKQVAKLARSQAPIYISGESGSGKELVAKTIHANGSRAAGPFIPVNCGAIPSELMESEFFGHRKGSFSGAHQDKEGLFKAANGGTLFLDEVADLPLDMQVKLLRAIQEKAVRAVGAEAEEHVDVRILSATHKDLQALVDDGDFRQDLFYRINVINLQVPSLRVRQSDIELLARRFLKDIAKECGVENAAIDAEAMDALFAYEFPGNVRELENIIERAFTLCEDDLISVQDLQLDSAPRLPTKKSYESHEPISPHAIQQVEGALHGLLSRREEQSLEDYLEMIERAEIEEALNATKWNRTAAAKKLGISFRALRYRLKKLEMD